MSDGAGNTSGPQGADGSQRPSLWKRIPKWGWGVIAGVFVLLLVVGSLSGDPDTGTSREVAVTTPPATLPTLTTPTTSGTDAAATTIREFLRTSFGIPGAAASWYSSITGVTVSPGLVNVETSINPANPNAREFAAPICVAVSGYVFSNQNTTGVRAVRVAASDGQRIILRNTISEPC
jgi:hypothetical protein